MYIYIYVYIHTLSKYTYILIYIYIVNHLPKPFFHGFILKLMNLRLE